MRKLCFALMLMSLGCPALLAADETAAHPATKKVPDTFSVMALLKVRCVKCHGPAKTEGELNLSTPGLLAHGGENGPAIAAGKLDESLLWQRVTADEMPPDEPLGEDERSLIRDWIAAGAPGLPTQGSEHPSGDHWAFVPLADVKPPQVADASRANTDIDRFLLAELEARGLKFNPEADRATLIRRVAFDLIGLPPTPEEVAAFQNDQAADAYARMVDRYLASPHYGERWGKFWLDAAGYADSNGYFNADSDRPLAYRYRDYVIRSFNEDKPWDRFVQEQLAGDELSGYVPGQEATPEVISLLEATHYLRNGQDGTGESDGNAEEVKNDRYAALESCMQIVASSLLGLTVQCAKCHDHKFEPLSQREYYQFQSVFYPAFNIDDWVKPNDRVVQAALPGEREAWQARGQKIDADIAALREEFAAWAKENRPAGDVLFRDEFAENGPPLADAWSTTAPGDDAPGGSPPVNLDSDQAPAAHTPNGQLRLLESGQPGERWISTKQSFDWAPQTVDGWIQVTFDIVNDKANEGDKIAERIAYYVAMRDFDDSDPVDGGNVMFEGKPAGGGAEIYLDYPGGDSTVKGNVGAARYEPGHNYGVRIARLADGQYQVEHLYDYVPDGKPVTLPAESLTSGGFGFMLCHGRGFIVDNLTIEQGDGTKVEQDRQLGAALQTRRAALDSAVAELEKQRGDEPGRIAWQTDRSATPPDVFLLQRGSHASPGDKVTPQPLAALAEEGEAFAIERPFDEANSTGRRLAWARWLTRDGSRPASLMARVQVNRIWQEHFGTGIVATAENLGFSGSPPSHPQLLEYLASRFVAGNWSVKAMHRLILNSAAYRQSSALDEQAFAADPENRLLWRMSARRLDAEALRDAVLATSGQLDRRMTGPYVPTTRDAEGEVLVDLDVAGANRRSLYLQQRRTQTLSLLGVFDSPSIVFNCVQRPVSTIPLQSLSLLNSPFLIEQAQRFAERVKAEAGDDAAAQVERAFVLSVTRGPTDAERTASLAFVESQRQLYGADARDRRPWSDFCQMLLASSTFLYVE